MSSAPTTTRIPAPIADRLSEFVLEATEGPDLGGIAGQVRLGQTVVDLAASRGWGVQVRVGDRCARVPATEATMEAVTAAVASLLA